MIYVYFFIKSVVKWSENSVRFGFLWEMPSKWAKFCEILPHSVRYGMYGHTRFNIPISESNRKQPVLTGNNRYLPKAIIGFHHFVGLLFSWDMILSTFPTNYIILEINKWAASCSSPTLIRSQGYKTYFMLNSADHEFLSANKYENANNSWHFHIY